MSETTLQQHGDVPSSEKIGTPEKPQEPKFSPPDYPDGGARAWSVALGAAGLLFSSFGIVNSFGVYQQYYQTHQLSHKSPDDISWIGSLQTFFLLSAALFGGPLFDLYGVLVIWPAVISGVFAVMMTSICKEYYQFILAQGVLSGCSSGFMMAPAMAAVSQYFLKKRGAAVGIAAAGSSIGGIIFPIALSRMLEHPSLGFGWAVRICAFIMLGVLLPSVSAIRTRLPPRKHQLFLWSAFKSMHFVSLIFAVFVLYLGVFSPFIYIPSYAVEQGMDLTLARDLPAILNGASFFGRIVPGILADRYAGSLNVLSAAAVGSGILCFCWQRITSHASIIAFSALYGFTSGACVSMLGVTMAQVSKDPRNIGTYIGMGMFFVSFAGLIGAPINGALLREHHSYMPVSNLSGTANVAGGLLIIVVKYIAGFGVFSKA